MKTLLTALLLLTSSVAQAAQFGDAQYKIVSDQGDAIANFDLNADLARRMTALPGQVPVGNAKGDVTLYQFYDLNCPFCREAAADVDAILRADKKLKLVFVPYAVLSIQSVQGALIEIAVAKILKPEQFVEFHRRIYAQRGLIDGSRALGAAKELGLDPEKVAAEGNTEATLNVLRTTATFGTDAKLVATPAYVIGNVAILGHPGRKALEKAIVSMRQCSKVVC